MPLAKIEVRKSRPAEEVEALGIPPSDVFIVLYEPPLENWGIRGGIPASEMNLGFNLKV